jgi:hypothetical protein
MTTKYIIIATLVIFFTLMGRPQAYAGNLLKYSRTTNAQIGITPINANGCSYEVRNQDGKVVLKGTINSNNTFFISTKKLGVGTYTFTLNGEAQQEFEIN